MSNTIPLPRPGSLGLIQYAGVDMLQYAAAVSAAKDARIKVLEDALGDADDAIAYYQWRKREMPWSLEEVAGLRAARMAYASEFPLNANGEPDVGNIHANIRAMKKRIKVLEDALRHISLCSQNSMSGKEECGRIARAALGDKT